MNLKGEGIMNRKMGATNLLCVALGMALSTGLTYAIYPAASDLLGRISLCVIGVLLVIVYFLMPSSPGVKE